MLYLALRLVGMLLLSALFARIALADASPEDSDEDDQPNGEQDDEEDWNQIIPVEAAKHGYVLSLVANQVVLTCAIPEYPADSASITQRQLVRKLALWKITAAYRMSA